jgi:hypothetical protein
VPVAVYCLHHAAAIVWQYCKRRCLHPLTLDSRTRRTLDKALDEGFAASGMPTANRLPPGKAAEGNPESIPGF